MVLNAHLLYQPAILSYERAIRLEPKEFAWRYYRAVVLQQMSQPDKALEDFSAALRLRSDYAPAILKRGDLLFQLGRFAESAAAYEPLLAQNPSSAEALYGLARVKYAQGDVSGAITLYRRACEAYPSFGAAYYALAVAERKLGQEAESSKNFDLAKRFTDSRPPASDPLLSQMGALSTGVFRRLQESDQLAKKGNMEEAARLNEETLARDPQNLSSVLNLLYLARFLNQSDDQVETLYEKAKQINAQVPLLYTYYGVAMVRRGKFDVASTVFRKAIEMRPGDAEPHKWLGEILERQNQLPEAMQNYQLALAADPSDHALQMKVWWTLITSGRGREAIPQLLPALQIDDSFTSMRLVLLGEAYRTTGEFGKSRQYLEQARSRVRNEGRPELLAQIEQELNDPALRR
jgi:tetratricopeptide (TPR) repeat protein